MAEAFDVGNASVGGDELLGGPATLDTGLARSPGTGYLVECDTGLRLLEWQAGSSVSLDPGSVAMSDTTVDLAGTVGLFTTHVGDGVRCIDALTENGTALAPVATVALVASTAGSWYFDGVASILWVHCSDGGTPTGKALIATVVELSKFGPGNAVFLRNGAPHVYYARLLTAPGVSVEVPADDIGALAATTFGALEFLDLDGLFGGDSLEGRRGLIAERLWQGRQVRIYRGDMAAVDRDTLALWSVATMERPDSAHGSCTVPLVTRGRLLDKPLCRATFELATYPSMDATLAGVAIPRVYGEVPQAVAMRIGSGRWKVANHAVAALSNPLTKDGVAVTSFAADLPLGEFTCSALFNTEQRLYVDATGRTDADRPGVALGLPGSLLAIIALDGGQLLAADLDAPALARVDEDRPVACGFQVLGGTVRDALDRVAQSAFLDWSVTRDNLLSARARDRLIGNLISNPGFEVDVAGWDVYNGAALVRITTQHARGVACGQVTKSAGDPLGYVRALPRRHVVAGRRYALTALVGLAPGSPATDTFRLALVDGVGTEDLSEPFSIGAGAWQAVSFISEGVGHAGATLDQTDITMDMSDITLDMGGVELRIYPQHGGVDAVVLLLDEVQWVETVPITDSVADVLGVTTEPLVLDRVLCRYGANGRTDDVSYATAEDLTLARLYPDAESRTIEGDLVEAADAALISAAVLDYYGTTRTRLSLALLGWGDEPIGRDVVLDVSHRRAPGLVNHSGLWRVLSLEEAQATVTDPPTIRLECVAHGDPAADRGPIV